MDDDAKSRLSTEDPTILFEEFVRRADELTELDGLDEMAARATRAAPSRHAGSHAGLDGDGADADAERIEIEALCTRAGPRANELRRRIEVFRVLRDLADTFADDEVQGDDASRAAAEPVLERLGRFERLRPLGQGGLSRVFLAWDPTLERDVALKVLSPQQIGTADARAWRLQEGRSLARLAHDGIVRVFDTGEADGHAYIAMERIQGPSLQQVLAARATPPTDAGTVASNDAIARSVAAIAPMRARLEIALQIARALAYCHAQGVLHRDVKPGNVILEGGTRAKLIDFGLAHLEDQSISLTAVTQHLVATPAYAAPEQVDDQRTGASAHSDQFSFGVLLYELVVGVHPFQQRTRDGTLNAISRALPTPPRKVSRDVSTDLEYICLCCLERDPADRYPSMAAVAEDLAALLDNRAITVRPPSLVKRVRLWTRRHRDAAVAIGVAGVAVIGLIGLWLWTGIAERAAFAARVAVVERRTTAVDGMQELESAYQESARLRQEGEALDAELVAHILGGSEGARGTALIHACSHALRQQLDRELKDVNKAAEAERPELARTLFSICGPLLGMDSTLCPECKENQVDRERGRVDLPQVGTGERVELWKIEHESKAPALFQLVACDPLRALFPGTYRCRRSRDGRVLSEVDFCARLEEPRWRLLLPGPPHLLTDEMIFVPGGKIEMLGASPDSPAVTTGAFWISKRLFTWRDMQVSVEIDPAGHSFPASVIRASGDTDDSIADVTWVDSDAMLVSAGLRLPSYVELRLAEQAPGFVTFAEFPDVASEYMTGCGAGGERSGLGRGGKFMRSLESAHSRPAPPAGQRNAFRAAISAPR